MAEEQEKPPKKEETPPPAPAAPDDKHGKLVNLMEGVQSDLKKLSENKSKKDLDMGPVLEKLNEIGDGIKSLKSAPPPPAQEKNLIETLGDIF